ncbi:hypothetical protein LSAT2_007559 [Lamellibrachia satsuma]|nr:hypothetical protein LSAT2_007559 [Lamellibrachia satsuma]
MSQADFVFAEPSSLETGSAEPTDVAGTVGDDDVAGYTDQVEVETHARDVDDVECKVTRGGELIPRSPINKPYRLSLAAFSGIMMICGFALATLGAMIAGRFGRYTQRHCPALWWTGLPPTILSVIGFYTVTNKSRRYLFTWGMLVITNIVTQTAIMGMLGNFTTALYEVWPLIKKNKGHDLCMVMVGRCYCQDYYHGVYSNIRMPNSQYIHEDVLWKETGFLHCEDVRFVSSLYYSAMSFFGLFAVVSLLGSVVAFAGSACSVQDEAAFEPLQDISGTSRGQETSCADDIYEGDSRYSQMKDMSTVEQEQAKSTGGSTSDNAAAATNVCIDTETGLRFSKWS